MAAPAHHMPFRSQSSAPTLVTGSNSVPELARFFTDIEYFFEDCQIKADADKNKWNMRVISNIVKLGEFHWAFLNISQFLMSHMRLSENKRDRAFRMAFTLDQWDKIHHQLVIVDINHHPDDSWPMPQILKAAEYILHGTAPPMIPVQQPAPALAQLAPAAVQEAIGLTPRLLTNSRNSRMHHA
ncbi:hypothetical protein H0H81_003953 [Sphagnurus paluster]|uniref:Uncharacterized protein n=1 Tax=Sphagnurus paluster TaxID=117069 RepID=A0A9P7K2C6_9AGAR|nr:hypothetical protein H0H81_003953 [Sphagnurus paluster]